MSDPRRTLEAITQLAQAATAGWPAYEATSAALAPTTITSSTGDHRSTDTPDPIHHLAVTHERYYETVAEITEAFGLLRDIQRRMTDVRKQDPATARAIDSAITAARCSGAVDPLCTNNSVRDTGENAGLCWRCIKRKQRDNDAAQAS